MAANLACSSSHVALLARVSSAKACCKDRTAAERCASCRDTSSTFAMVANARQQAHGNVPAGEMDTRTACNRHRQWDVDASRGAQQVRRTNGTWFGRVEQHVDAIDVREARRRDACEATRGSCAVPRPLLPRRLPRNRTGVPYG
mmetsp:Transcript_11507/g.70777  ORF Transcript_11507/g.70777 Transcript_11507/m.70777 type:complete len:144 (+) Transcript_11507:2197-2628(+)